MPLQNRTTLKNYFKSGSLPSEDQFADLIDSMLNMRDEGFNKTPDEGFKITQLREGRLISFLENKSKKPVWSIIVDLKSDDRRLHFLNKDNKEILTLTPEGKVGIKQKYANFELDVAGTIASTGRIGRKGDKVHANGYWQNITKELEGCNALEIMAGVGKKNSGQYALLHAYALKTFNARGKIVYHQAHYGSRCNRIKLRWKKKKNKKYILQMKTPCSYGKGDIRKKSQRTGTKADKDVGIYIQYYVTDLWFDPFMTESQDPEPAKPAVIIEK